jgi:hypothetical protein
MTYQRKAQYRGLTAWEESLVLKLGVGSAATDLLNLVA